MKRSLPILCLFLIGYYSCGKSSGDTTSDVDIYISGKGVSKNGPAKYWKNGIPVILSDGSQANETTCGIVVSGTDVYVGQTLNTGASPAEYWKNGQLIQQGNLGDRSLSIAVSGGDVYLSGQTYTGGTTAALYWKNGNPTNLPDSLKGSGNAIAVSGDNVAVAGLGTDSITGIAVAKYWINGNPVDLALTGAEIIALPSSIAFYNNDVYVAGNSNAPNGNYIAKIWKNGVPTALSDNTLGSWATSMFISGSDIYVSGYVYEGSLARAVYWKNGIQVNLSKGQTYDQAMGIAVSGNDVYVIGYIGNTNGPTFPVYWKNGNAVKISSEVEYVTGIFLVKK